MLLTLNDVAPLIGTSWCALELSDRPEPAITRVVERAPSIFGDSPFEMLVPIGARDLGVYELLSPFLYVRSTSRHALLKLRSITGCTGLLTAGDTRHATDVILIEDSHVQEIAHRCEEAFLARSAGITTGSFVRVLAGRLKDFCGTVGGTFDSRCKILITMKTKQIFLETEVRNLLNLDYVPAELRVWYFNESLSLLDPMLIAEDLEMNEPEPEPELPPLPVPRSATMTAYLRELIEGGELNPANLARATVKKMLAGEVPTVANVRAFRATLLGTLLQAVRGGPTSYGSFLKQNRQYTLDITTLREIIAPLGLPELSPSGGHRGRMRGQRNRR